MVKKKHTHTKTSDKILPSTNLNSLKFTDSNSLTFNGVEEYGVSHHTSYQPTEHVHAGPHIVHTAPFTSHSPTQILHTPPFTSHSPTQILHTPTASHIACTPTTAHSLRSPTVSRIRTSSRPHTPINSINPHIFQDIENLPSVRPAAESSNSNILERVFGEIYLLKDELSRQGRVLDKILEKMDSQTAPPEPKLQNELLVPFNTVEEVEEFDNSLSNIDVQKDLMMKLRRFGGSMHQDHARRIMRYLQTA